MHGNQFCQFVVDSLEEIFTYQFAKGRFRYAVFHSFLCIDSTSNEKKNIKLLDTFNSKPLFDILGQIAQIFLCINEKGK